MSDEFVKRTKTWLDGHPAKDKDKPFFLYYASQCIHVPRMPNSRFVGKGQLGLRGDSMVEPDWVVGELLRMLEELGLSENTMDIFSSENGPVYDDGYQDGSVTKKSSEETDRGHNGSGIYRDGMYKIYEGGTRVPMIVSWAGRIKPGTTNALVSHTDSIASFLQATARKAARWGRARQPVCDGRPARRGSQKGTAIRSRKSPATWRCGTMTGSSSALGVRRAMRTMTSPERSVSRTICGSNIPNERER